MAGRMGRLVALLALLLVAGATAYVLLGREEDPAPARTNVADVGPRPDTRDAHPAQRVATRAMKGTGGSAVVLELPSGEVLARAGRSAARSLVRPGSTLKSIIAVAALDARVDVAELDGDGSKTGLTNAGGERTPPLTLEDALVRSTNTAFADLLERIAPWRMQDALRRVGYFKPLTPGGVASGRPIVPRGYGSGTRKFIDADGTFHDPDRLQVSTPLQLAVNAASLADGRLPEAFGNRRRVWSASAARRVRRAMRAVVTRGTATSLKGLDVAAKTGTMPRDDGRVQASLIALVPAGKPRYAVAVTRPAPRDATGDSAAGPPMRAIVRALLR